MERLTYRYENEIAHLIETELKDACEYCYDAAQKLANYEDLEERIEKLFDGKISLAEAVDNIEKKVHGEENFRYSRILTNAEAEKWDKWLELEEQGRLITLPCKIVEHRVDEDEDYLTEFGCEDFLDKNDVVEVKHGCWVYDPDGMDWGIGAWRCSECHCKNDNLGSYENINPYHYAGAVFCPHCGVKMERRWSNG